MLLDTEVFKEENPDFHYARVTPVTMMLYRLEQLADLTGRNDFRIERSAIACMVNAAAKWLQDYKCKVTGKGVSQAVWQRVMILVIEIDTNTRG